MRGQVTITRNDAVKIAAVMVVLICVEVGAAAAFGIMGSLVATTVVVVLTTLVSPTGRRASKGLTALIWAALTLLWVAGSFIMAMR